MKSRRVFIQLEIETERSLRDLKDKKLWWISDTEILQVQVNVAKREAKKGGRKKP